MAKNKVITNGNGVKIDISGFKTVTIRNKKTGELKQGIAIDIDEDDEELNLSPEEEARINEMYEMVCRALKKIGN